MSVKIITDSVSDISDNVAVEYDIEVLKIGLTIDGKKLEAEDITVKEMVEWVEKNKKIPEFRGITSQRYADAFKKYIDRGDDIVCITAGDLAISNYDSAMHASTQFPNANIHIINTEMFSGAVGLLAVQAAKMARADEAADAIAIKCERSIEKNKQTSLMDSFDFLKYAGAVPKIVAAGTNLLNAKFSFSMNKGDERESEVLGYSMDKAVKKFCAKLFDSLYGVNPETVFLTYTLSDEEYMNEVYKYAVNTGYFGDVVMCQSGLFNTSFVGRNCVTVTYQMK